MDPVYGFARVNVEAQQRDPSSFLHWVRRMLQVRSEHPVFGLGSFDVLEASNPSVLAFLREYERPERGVVDRVLCVSNLSKAPQPVELSLQRFNGFVPTELTGGVAFPAIGELPYFVTLAPYGSYWFALTDGTELPTA